MALQGICTVASAMNDSFYLTVQSDYLHLYKRIIQSGPLWNSYLHTS